MTDVVYGGRRKHKMSHVLPKTVYRSIRWMWELSFTNMESHFNISEIDWIHIADLCESAIPREKEKRYQKCHTTLIRVKGSSDKLDDFGQNQKRLDLDLSTNDS